MIYTVTEKSERLITIDSAEKPKTNESSSLSLYVSGVCANVRMSAISTPGRHQPASTHNWYHSPDSVAVSFHEDSICSKTPREFICNLSNLRGILERSFIQITCGFLNFKE